jgi:hypothetical protein
MVICSKNQKKFKIFLKIKYDPGFILVTLKCNNITANEHESRWFQPGMSMKAGGFHPGRSMKSLFMAKLELFASSHISH